MQLTATGALMRLAETAYAAVYIDDRSAPGRELADAGLVLAAAGLPRWAEIAARIIESWPPSEQVDYLRERGAAVSDPVRAHFHSAAAWPQPVGDGEQMVELTEIGGGALRVGDGMVDFPIDGMSPTDAQIAEARFNQIETDVNAHDERLSQIESALDFHEAGIQVVAAALSRHVRRSGTVPRWSTLEEFHALLGQVIETDRVPLDGMLPDLRPEVGAGGE